MGRGGADTVKRGRAEPPDAGPAIQGKGERLAGCGDPGKVTETQRETEIQRQGDREQEETGREVGLREAGDTPSPRPGYKETDASSTHAYTDTERWPGLAGTHGPPPALRPHLGPWPPSHADLGPGPPGLPLIPLQGGLGPGCSVLSMVKPQLGCHLLPQVSRAPAALSRWSSCPPPHGPLTAGCVTTQPQSR